MTNPVPLAAPITIAIVEDTESVAETLATLVNDTFGAGAEVIVEQDFERALSLTGPGLPDILVLDWYDDALPHPELQGGLPIWDKIWKTRLIPIVIWSAHDVDPDPPIPVRNPLIRYIAKGDGSEEKVVAFIKESLPFVMAMRGVVEDISAAGRSVLLDAAPLIWQLTETDVEQRSNVLLRTTRRRLAAHLDIPPESELLAAWEQYIVPPFGASLLVGDVIRQTSGSKNDPSAFRLVLTPSCDLHLRGGKCKVDTVLTARCTGIKDYLDAVRSVPSDDEGTSEGGSATKSKRLKRRLNSRLGEPHFAGYVPLPAFLDVVPDMAANLRALDLIPIGDISTDGSHTSFERVVSTDSPFREHIAWAYLQIAGRPGIPDRDTSSWAETIVDAYP